jgi:hypothetical protein
MERVRMLGLVGILCWEGLLMRQGYGAWCWM